MSNKTILQAKNTRLNANNTDLSSILQTINNLPEQTEVKLQTKTVSPSTAVQNVTADSGYDGLSKVTVNAMSTTTQATPSISVNSSGLITASATQSAGYVSAGTKSSTKQLTTKAATTYTPTTSNQTIASGTYLTGTQTIKGDSNLIASNIRSGKSIFGVAGTLVEGITPTGTLDITENGSYDVTNYASANVNVASSGGGSGGLLTGGGLRWLYNASDQVQTATFWGRLEAGKNYELHFTVFGQDMMGINFTPVICQSGWGQYVGYEAVSEELGATISLKDNYSYNEGGINDAYKQETIDFQIYGEDLTESLNMMTMYIKEV